MKPKDRKWAQKAIKEGDAEVDIPEKFRVIKILEKHYGLHGLTGEAVVIPRTGWARFPDVFIKAHVPQIAILLHGDAPFHTEGSVKEAEVKLDYESAGVKLIIIWEALTDYTTEKIMEVLDDAGLQRVV